MMKKFDVTVIGAGLAGQSCALVAVRGLLSVAILDNANYDDFATHNFITNDGLSKQQIAAKGLADLAKYPNLETVNELAADVAKTEDGYLVTTEAGLQIKTTKLVFAMGNSFDFSKVNIEGLQSIWGKTAFTCAYCHAYEYADKPVAVIAQTPSDINFIKLLSRWTKKIIVFNQTTSPEVNQLINEHVPDVTHYDEAIKGVQSQNGQVTAVVLANGNQFECEALFISDVETHSNALIDRLRDFSVFNPQLNRKMYKTDPYGRTDLKDVFIIGDSKTRFSTLVGAANEGFMAGVMLINDYV